MAILFAHIKYIASLKRRLLTTSYAAKNIFELYDYNSICAIDIYVLLGICNSIINTVAHRILQGLEEQHKVSKLQITEETERFCKSYIADGQHIVKKNINEILLKDLRALYK